MRSGDKETPLCPSSCNGDAVGAGSNWGTHGRGWHFQYGVYVRKMALNGYVIHVDLSGIRELVSFLRRCTNNLNQMAIHVNTYGGIYPDEIKTLQWDYADLWRPLSDLLKKLSVVVNL